MSNPFVMLSSSVAVSLAMVKFPLSSRFHFDPTVAIRQTVFVLGKLSLAGAALLCVQIGDVWRSRNNITLPHVLTDEEPTDRTRRGDRDPAAYSIIETRNLFGSTPRQTVVPTPQRSARRKLRLLGTTITTQMKPIAIIEDTVKRREDVFELGDTVFQEAKLVEVLPDRVKLSYGTEEEFLRLDESDRGVVTGVGIANPAGFSGSSASSALENELGEDEEIGNQGEFVVSEKEVAEALTNLPLLLSQARAVPFFRNGQSIGLRLFAIRQGSLYEKVGLKNGDIIEEINGTSLSDPTQGIKLFEELKNERSVTVKIERAGVKQELRYSIR